MRNNFRLINTLAYYVDKRYVDIVIEYKEKD